jgi:hypothetical protein
MAKKPTKPTYKDADLILKLYELRREPELRKARNWFLVTFWPETAADYLQVEMAMGSLENNWLRQAVSYWNMAAALVLHGTLHRDLFLEPACSGEMFFLFAKVNPFLQELRERTQNPHLFANIEKVIKSSKVGRDRLAMIEKRVAARKTALLAKASETQA